MDTRDCLEPARGPRSFAPVLRRWACTLSVVFYLVPAVALADARLAAADEEAPAPMPFQLPAASASAELEAPGLPLFSLLLLLLSGGLVAGTLMALFHSLSQRDAAQQQHHHPVHGHAAHGRRW